LGQVRDQVRDQVWDQVEGLVWGQELKHYTAAEENLLTDSGWVSFYDFFQQIGILKHQNFAKYADYLASGVFYTIFLQGLAVICERPKYIKRDDFYRLHCADGPATLWKDGYAQYFWHGVSVPQKLIEAPEEITKDELIKETNAEVRRAMMERLGTGRFFQLLDVVEVDRDRVGVGEYAKEYTLYRTREIDPVAGEYIQFVNVICHSTEREYMLCVPPNIKDVWSGVAWTFAKTKEEYTPLKEA
jgi:hypothetical protein